MLSISTVLKLLDVVGPVTAKLPDFKAVFDQLVSTFKQQDQAVLREAYEDLIADNDAGHARLQQKLSAAALL